MAAGAFLNPPDLVALVTEFLDPSAKPDTSGVGLAELASSGTATTGGLKGL